MRSSPMPIQSIVHRPANWPTTCPAGGRRNDPCLSVRRSSPLSHRHRAGRSARRDQMKNELTRRGALRSAAAGIAVLGATGGSVAAQDATPSAGADGLSRLELARLAGELRAALVPVVASLRAQTEDELTESAKTYVEQLQE